MGFFLRPVPAAVGLACLTMGLNAAWSEENSTIPQLGEVVVTGKPLVDLPAAHRVDEDNRHALGANTSDVVGLLRNIPGVSAYSAGGVSSLPVIHGFADDRNRIKVDGMDLIAACPNHMNSPLSYLDPSNLGELQVYTGLTPVSVGGDSIGGAIIANSKGPEFSPSADKLLTKGELGAYYRSNGHANGVHATATLASQRLALTYGGSTSESDNYKAGREFKNFLASGRPGHNLARDEVGSTAYKSRNQSLGIATRWDNHLLEAKFSIQDIPYELYPNQRMDMLGNKEERTSLRYLGQFDWGSLEARAYQEHVRHHMDFGADKQYIYGAAPSVVAPGMPMDTRTDTSGASVKGEIKLNPRDLLRIGGEFQTYRLNDWWPPSPSVLPPGFTSGGMAPNTFLNINNGKRDRNALYGEWEAHWSERWQSLIGLRAEQVKTNADAVHGYNNNMGGYVLSAAAFNAKNRSKTDNNLDLTALGRYTPDATQSYEFGYQQKTRSPNLYERYSWSQNSMALIMNNFVGDGNGYLGNVDLKPEVAHTLSFTGDWHSTDREWQLVASPYYSRVTNYIDAVRCLGSGTGMNALCGGAANNTASNKFVQLQYANQSARIYGLDLSGKMPLGLTGWGRFGLQGLLNYTKGKNLDTDDGLYNIMPLNTRLTLTHQWGGWNNALEVVAVKAKTDVSDVRQEIKTPGYSLVNLRGSYSWSSVRVDFGVENLFDKLYYLPQGGAYAGQGMTMSTNGIPWGIVVPGMGRSVYASVNVKF